VCFSGPAHQGRHPPTVEDLLSRASAFRRKGIRTPLQLREQRRLTLTHADGNGSSGDGGDGGSDGGSDSGSDIDDGRLYCVCQRPAVHEDELWVCCDGCEEWYHPACVGLDDDTALALPSYTCARCEAAAAAAAATGIGKGRRSGAAQTTVSGGKVAVNGSLREQRTNGDHRATQRCRVTFCQGDAVLSSAAAVVSTAVLLRHSIRVEAALSKPVSRASKAQVTATQAVRRTRRASMSLSSGSEPSVVSIHTSDSDDRHEADSDASVSGHEDGDAGSDGDSDAAGADAANPIATSAEPRTLRLRLHLKPRQVLDM
jgi:hypothetical protein